MRLYQSLIVVFRPVFPVLVRAVPSWATTSWGRHLWARGYFVCSTGNVTDEVIAQYIRLQGAEPQEDDRFRISE